MGGGLAAYEDSGKVFLWRSVSSVGRRSYSALQELDTPSFLPSSESRRDSKLPRYGFKFNDWIFSGLFRNGFRFTREEI
jgi:hypothetical protein